MTAVQKTAAVTTTQKPELTVADVIESLNDAYCELQDGDYA